MGRRVYCVSAHFFCASVLLIVRGNLLLEAFDVYLFADGFDQIFFSTKL